MSGRENDENEVQQEDHGEADDNGPSDILVGSAASSDASVTDPKEEGSVQESAQVGGSTENAAAALQSVSNSLLARVDDSRPSRYQTRQHGKEDVKWSKAKSPEATAKSPVTSTDVPVSASTCSLLVDRANANFLEQRKTNKNLNGSEEPVRSSVPSVISTRNTNVTMSALTTSTTSNAGNHCEWDAERSSIESSQAVTKRTFLPLLRGEEGEHPQHSEHDEERQDPIEPELVVATRVTSMSAPPDEEGVLVAALASITHPKPADAIELDPDLILVQAKPAKVEDSLKDLLKSRRGRLLILAIILLVAFIAGFPIGLKGFSGRNNNNNDDDDQGETDDSYFLNSSEPSQSPSSLPTSAAPTRLPTSTPTAAPSTVSPTPEFQGFLVANNLLPHYSLVSLQNASSPQSKALQWLEDNHSTDSVTTNSTTRDRLLQRFALATFYYATNGFGWQFNRYWLSDAHECEWWSHLEIPGAAGSGGSQRVCNDNGEYTALLMDNNILHGTLPPELALLTHLEDISLVADSFGVSKEDKKTRFLTGGIPTEYGLFLSNLREFDVSKNALSSTIPSEMGLLSNTLESFKVLENNMTGSLPVTLSHLTKCRNLFVYDNSFTGQIASELGLLTASLTDFNAIKNKLSGFIPSELALLTQLTALSLQENQLVSTVPSELARLVSLEWFLLKHNRLTGTLPPQLGNLRYLRL